MRILLLSDIHANLVALETVLTNAGEFDACWCLGDIVGYGPQPNRCIDLIRSQPNLLCVLGNHDAAVSGVIDLERFNSDARTVVEWTKSQVTKKTWIGSLNCPSQRLLDLFRSYTAAPSTRFGIMFSIH